MISSQSKPTRPDVAIPGNGDQEIRHSKSQRWLGKALPLLGSLIFMNSARSEADLPLVHALTHRVHLSPEQAALAGITAKTLPRVTRQPEFSCYGRVIDVGSLLELKQRFQAAEANLEVLNAHLALSTKNLARIQSLHDAHVVPARDLVQHEAQWHADQARQKAAALELESLQKEILYRWGRVLATRVMDKNSQRLDALLRHETALIQVTLPRGQKASAGQSHFFVAHHLDRQEAAEARVLSAAPRTDDLIQGESWFLEVEGEHFRAGMRIHAWFTTPEAWAGLETPRSSVLWIDGKPWIYLEESAGAYRRIPVELALPDSGKTLLLRENATEQPVVITGAQSLLAEEFRGHIPSEDRDAE